ncbi:MFS transporter [Kocuria sp. SL71]|uniref:MFS transporter n=1 Tax=Kocuria sp. SL71 TaxID=2995151 RepID=UPI002272D12C|nr:MFS transporter [Kocuria sp. SL71]MCY1684328.1 MFS transporter [Kocuria sp. SL71]
MKTAIWVAAIASTALIFDGYGLVVYGTVIPTLLNDPSQIGPLDPSIAGTVGSLALIGVLLGSFASGFIGDILGRKRMLMSGIAWFSSGMATKDRRGVFNTIVCSGVPAGGMFASLCGIFLGEAIGWRGLLLIAATPILFLFPLAALKLPESPRWLLARGHDQRAIEVANRTGVPLQEELMDSRAATASDRLGKPQNVIATTFALAAITPVLVTFHFPLPLLVLFIAVVGVVNLGTQALVYGFQANYCTSNARAAGAAMCASQQFYVFAVVALLGAIVTVLLPHKHNTYLIERRLLIDGDAKPEEVQAAREAAAESPLVVDGASVPAQGPRTGA